MQLSQRLVSLDAFRGFVVQNTGHLNGSINADGFGIKSTQDRLDLMYQGKGVFEIKNIEGGMVESKVSLPVTI